MSDISKSIDKLAEKWKKRIEKLKEVKAKAEEARKE